MPADNLELITDRNRYHPEMFGGWGPHLRAILRDRRGGLWFTVDSGPDVGNNTSIHYLRKSTTGWEDIARNELQRGVSQNVASVIYRERTILSYSLSTFGNNLYECSFDTEDHSERRCAVIEVDGEPLVLFDNSNYVGAAVGVNGTTRIVYWATQGTVSGPAIFSYLYHQDREWHGPVHTALPGASIFAYISARLSDSGSAVLCGEVHRGEYPAGSYVATVATIARLGEPVRLHALGDDSGGYAEACEDIFIHRKTGATHIAARKNDGSAYYYFKEQDAVWDGDAMSPRQAFPPGENGTQMVRMKFIKTRPALRLLVSDGRKNRIDIYRSPATDLGRPIVWSRQEMTWFSIPDSRFGGTSAFYVDSDQQQGEDSSGVHFAVTGNPKSINPSGFSGDGLIYYVELAED